MKLLLLVLHLYYKKKKCGERAEVERLRHRSREQKLPSSSPGLVITVEVTSQC